MYRSIILVTCLALLVGCSRTELVYRNADWLTYRWVDGLLNADSAQSEQWPLWFEQTMEEHRRDLLPQVVSVLQAASIHADRGLTVNGLQCLWQDANHLIDAHARLAVPTATRVLTGISREQIENLSTAFEERNAEYKETYLDPDPDRREVKRVERFTARIERWTGELTPDQQSLVTRMIRRMPDVSEHWLSYRDQQQQRLLALLREDSDPQTIERFLVAWWVEQSDRKPELMDRYFRIRDAWVKMLVDLDGTLDDDQRARVVARVGDLRDDLAGEANREVALASPMGHDLPCRTLL